MPFVHKPTSMIPRRRALEYVTITAIFCLDVGSGGFWTDLDAPITDVAGDIRFGSSLRVWQSVCQGRPGEDRRFSIQNWSPPNGARMINRRSKRSKRMSWID
jgi:hypothetical protein